MPSRPEPDVYFAGGVARIHDVPFDLRQTEPWQSGWYDQNETMRGMDAFNAGVPFDAGESSNLARWLGGRCWHDLNLWREIFVIAVVAPAR